MASKPTPTFDSVKVEYAALWQSMTIRPDKQDSLKATAFRIASGRPRYDIVSKATGIPWWFIGIVHQMECGLSWGLHLHNGDPLSARTRQVPAGRIPAPAQPPFAWEDSAVDALTMKGFDKITDWTLERVAYCLETYNGFGYRLYHPEVHSPYLWSFTTAYTSGKYVADRVWSAGAVSGQPGAMAILKAMKDADPAIDPPMIADQPVVAFPKATGAPSGAVAISAAPPNKVAVAATSKTVWNTAAGGGLLLLAKWKAAMIATGHVAAITAVTILNSLPDIVHDSKESKKAFADLGAVAGTEESMVFGVSAIGILCLLIAISRHVDLKSLWKQSQVS